MKQTYTYLAKDLRVSVLEWSDSDYELAVQFKRGIGDKWTLDYSVVKDVIKLDSPMQVYGAIAEIRGLYNITDEEATKTVAEYILESKLGEH